MDMIFIEILQLNCYAVPELPPSRNPLHNCINNMAIHPDKSKCMLIATKQKLKRGSTLLLNIGNTQIENLEAQKLLGIYIDNTLSWTHQVSYIRKREN